MRTTLWPQKPSSPPLAFIESLPDLVLGIRRILGLAAAIFLCAMCGSAQAPNASIDPLPGVQSSVPQRRPLPQHPASAATRPASTLANTVTPQVATPVFSVAAGTYSGPQSVTITTTTPGASIYYTTNGSYPSSSSTTSTLYAGPVTVSSPSVLVAIATVPGYTDSDYASASYLFSGTPTSFVYTVAGSYSSGWSGDGGPATAARLNNPQAAAVDAHGNLYIADTGNNLIRKVDASTGAITTIAGTGVPAHTGDNGPAASAALWSPQALAFDPAGNLYVAESGDSEVRVINASTGVISTYAGTTSGSAPLPAPATSVVLGPVNAITFDSLGNLYIASNFYILKVDAGTAILHQLTNGGFSFLDGIAVDNALNIFVSDQITNQIFKVDQAGATTLFAGTSYAAGGDGGPALQAGLSRPGNLAFGPTGNLYVADSGTGVIREIDAQTGIIQTVAGTWFNFFSLSGAGDPATSYGLLYPRFLSADPLGNLYIADASYDRILEITAPAAPPTAATPAPTFSLAPGSFSTPAPLSITSSIPKASIYLTFDGAAPLTSSQGYHSGLSLTGSATLRAIAVAPGYLKSPVADTTYTFTGKVTNRITTVVGTGKFGFSGIGGPATAAQIAGPTSVAFDAANNAYITDQRSHAVLKIDAGSGNISIFAGTGSRGFDGDGGPATAARLSSPSGLAFDSTGNLFIADSDNNRIRKVDTATGTMSTIAGGNDRTPDLGDGGLATSASLLNPIALAFDSSGNLFIADHDNARVRRIDVASGIITTAAGGANSFADGGPGTATTIYPAALAIDSQNRLYIADTSVGRIRVLDPLTQVITSIAGTFNANSDADGVLAAVAPIEPVGLAFDAFGNLYFSDWPWIVRKIDAATGILSTVAGNGYYGYSGDGGPGTMATLYTPQQIAVDKSGVLWVPDQGGSTVRKVDIRSQAAAPSFTPPAGAYTGAQSVTLTSSTPGATLYYTTDGTTPTTASTVFSGTIPVGRSVTVKAIAAAPNYSPSNVASAAYSISYLPATVSLSSSANPAYVSNPITLMATIIASGGIPTGTVDFMDGATKLGTGTLAAGAASITTSTLTVGQHTITAIYSGDSQYGAITSPAIAQAVVDFTAGPSGGAPIGATVSKGGTATYKLSFAPSAGSTFPSDITFAISGLPAGFNASFSPASIPAGSAATDVTLSVAVPTTAALHSAPLPVGNSNKSPLLLSLAVLPLFGLRRVRRAFGSRLLILALAVIGTLALGLSTGCGGSGGGSGGSGTPQSQTYGLTVTANAGTLAHTIQLTLTVK